MTTIPETTHQFEKLFLANDNRVFRISICDEDIFRLNCFVIVNPTIYGIADQWNASIVEAVAGKHPKFHKLFHANMGVDFVESDVTEIADDQSGEIIYRRNT